MNNKRILVYILIIFAFICGVFVKQRMIIRERNREITSVTEEWKTKGKPVAVERITRGKVKVYTKITITLTGKDYYEVYVPKAIQEKLHPGQLIFLDARGGNPIGKVMQVDDDINLDTGMFLVRAVLNAKIAGDRRNMIIYVNTGVLKNVICLPREIITFDNEESFVWKIEEGLARKTPVVIGEHNGYGAVIESGLKEGDFVVFEGYTNLFDADKVNVISGLDRGDRK